MAIAVAALSLASPSVMAIGREDRIECRLPDGAKIILRSRYDFSLVPLPLVHASRESDRRDWDAEYHGMDGGPVDIPISVFYYGKQAVDAALACAHFGLRNGVALGPMTFRYSTGKWASREKFPRGELDVTWVYVVPNELPAHLRQKMDEAGIKDAAPKFGFIVPMGGRLVYEQPLHKTHEGFAHTRIFDAVFQSFSDDQGTTWSSPVVTTDALIFELGKTWLQQSFVARPVSLNGVKIPPQ
ncbi:hypothetical protein [Niveibacterium umoris]|uniref:Uncharacterized protein n=1 Tax=Niveibacterium umoris TaxID=1193620 RepID=A0A840BJR2_9RHOO|nr:hypothetical protein [Niveibacterium umoris]MBB4013485.1 hypothetical protein [Niveibacterium umoris]